MIQDADGCFADPDPQLQAVVIVPARNEAVHLPATLRSLAHQSDLQGRPLTPRTFEVIVLANQCTDATASLARQFAADFSDRLTLHVVERTFDPAQAHIGTARRWLMDQACNRLKSIGRHRGLIASTDADTRVHPTWVNANLAEIAAGADAVAGLIRLDLGRGDRHGPTIRRAALLDRVYRRLKLELEALLDPNPLDPNPGHDYHGGASLAITPVMYRQVGGLPPLSCLEDVALVQALWLADARLVHSRRVRVRTSARAGGRARGGLSQEMTRWQSGEPDRVVAPAALEVELKQRRELRRIYLAATATSRSAGGWVLPDRYPAELGDELRGLPNFGQWLDAVRRLSGECSRWDKPDLMPIHAAIEDLHTRIKVIRRGS